MNSEIFKAYDIRGVYPTEINELDVYKTAVAICQFLEPTELVVGSDVRLSSPALKRAAIKAITDQGIRVIDVGEISTDMLYYAVGHYGYAGGLTITASHNPKEYNGMKIVREESRPISSDSGLFIIRDIAFGLEIDETVLKGDINESLIEHKDIMDSYARKVRTFANLDPIKPFKIIANPNFGVGGRALEKILAGTSIEIIKLNYESDGNFPKGRPDPLIPENREEISRLVVEHGADFGVAWDADADRCFFFTEKGEFIEGYFITALLARIFLKRNNDQKIVHDTRLTWAIEDIVSTLGGKNVPTKAGHSFIKERMRKENAVFGGEMSAHYYFRDYYFCDCGMIPLVMMIEYLSGHNRPLSMLMRDTFWKKYFVSGEINVHVRDVLTVIANARARYEKQATSFDEQDGISLNFVDKENESKSWRFSVRGSNTEPLIRLNVEAKSKELMEEKRDELLAFISA
ncbi:MAG: phosphomannomutase/phosphoglucomutase [bacterium]